MIIIVKIKVYNHLIKDNIKIHIKISFISNKAIIKILMIRIFKNITFKVLNYNNQTLMIIKVFRIAYIKNKSNYKIIILLIMMWI